MMPRPPTRQSGFTLLELSIVLAIIGLIIGAVTIGRDVQRNAAFQRISSEFVQGWALAYDSFHARQGIVPGDNPAAPTGLIPGLLCGNALLNTMLAAGVDLPEGRAAGSQDRFVYLDSNGNPQELQVCFNSVQWSEPGATVGTYVVRQRNVMVISGLTPALANFLDNSIDGRSDARFGKLRESTQAAVIGAAPVPWSVDERMAFDSTTATTLDESQVAVVTGFMRMNY